MDTKTLYITGRQALRLHRAARAGEIVCAATVDTRSITPSPLLEQSADELGLSRLMEWLNVTKEHPLHVLSPSAEQRCRTIGICSHVIRHTLPSGSFLEITTGSDSEKALPIPANVRVLIDAPPLIIVNMANELNDRVRKEAISELVARLRLIALANELCGSYARDPIAPQSRRCHYDETGKCNRFSTPDEVRAALDEMRGLKGSSRARYAAKYILDHSGSPMETYLDMALFLPPRLAGLGMPTPLLNKKLQVSEKVHANLKHSTLRPDIQWPDFNTLAEYLGDKEHASKKARIEDKNRGQDYSTAGFTSYFLMFDDVKSQTALKRTAEMLARTLTEQGAHNELSRLERVYSKKGFYEKQTSLIKTLLPPVLRYDQGGY